MKGQHRMSTTFIYPNINGFIFFLCRSVVKNAFLDRNPHRIYEFKEYISDVFTEIDAEQDLFCAICHQVLQMFEVFGNIEGGHLNAY